MKVFLLQACLSLFTLSLSAQVQQLNSPNRMIWLTTGITAGKPWYSVQYQEKQVILKSQLGIERQDEKFVEQLTLTGASPVEKVTESYSILNAKRARNTYTANKQTLHFKNAQGKKLDIIFQLSNDGLAFRYYFPETSTEIKTITAEYTSWNLGDSVKGYLQPMQEAQGGWEHVFPCYEEHYKQHITPETPCPTKAGWVYPALFKTGNTWVLLTEAAIDTTWCATRLQPNAPHGEYKIGMPDPREVFTGKGLLPQSQLPWYTPWRIVAIGSLKTMVESTLGTDLAKPAIGIDPSFIKPGKASWSWALLKDNSITYDIQKQYIDYAADMHWQYTLIDVDWDTRIGYEKIQELAGYAATKNVGLILWYNSSGEWNTTKYHPKGALLTHEAREAEFKKIHDMGIRGVKIDFFNGDGQSMIKYYQDILVDAAKYNLLVNFHGATLPRGWARTYPHLMSAEGVKGFEMISFSQSDADAEANHCTMLPFARNMYDPMDFTPMCLYKIPGIKRKTTSGFELALSVAFLSGIQHYAESPEGMSHQPGYVKAFLQNLPTHWDDVKFIDGYPGKLYVVARRSGKKWYVAGLNGETQTKELELNLAGITGKKGTLITDGAEPLTYKQETIQIPTNKKYKVTIAAEGGFVIVIE